MADDTLQTFRDTISDLLDRVAGSARNTQSGRAFFDDARFGSADDVLKLFDRTEDVKKLKSLLEQEHSAADWAVPKSTAEFLAGWERDVRAARRTRLDRYRAAAQEKAFILASVDQYLAELDRIQSQQSGD